MQCPGQAGPVPFAYFHTGAVGEHQPVATVDARHQFAAQRFVLVQHFYPGTDTQALHLTHGHSLPVGKLRRSTSGFLGNRQDDVLDHQHFAQGLALSAGLHRGTRAGTQVQLFQLQEEFAGRCRVQGHAGQAIAQCLEQARYLLQQGMRLMRRSDAGQQRVHRLQGIPPGLGCFTLLEPGQQQYLAPGLHQHLYHHLRQ